MSIKIMSKVWDNADDVKGDALVVLLALADWANDDGLCWPKMATIAAKARITETAASHIVNRLQSKGFLTIERGQGRGRQSHYIVHPRGDGQAQNETENDAETDTENPTLRNPFPENPFPKKGIPQTLKPPSRKPLSPRRAYKDEPSVLKPSEPSVCVHAPETSPVGETATSAATAPVVVTAQRRHEPQMVDMGNPKDPRFTTPYFPAVARACLLRPEPMNNSPKMRGQIAYYAAELERLEYSVEQIAAAGKNWQMKDPPTPEQLFNRIDSLLAPKEKTNGQRTELSADSQRLIAIYERRAARNAAGTPHSEPAGAVGHPGGHYHQGAARLWDAKP